jgi:hypothetical protein
MLTHNFLCLKTDQYTEAWTVVVRTDFMAEQMETICRYSKFQVETFKYKLN